MFSADMECCLWAYHDRLRETHALKSSVWRKPSGEEMTMADLLSYVGANKKSTDVHWPLSFSLSPKHLTNLATQRRLLRKWERSYWQASPGRAASSSQSNWWSSSDWSGWGGWWSGSSSWSGWHQWWQR